MNQQQQDVPWWRNHPWMGRHLFRENRNKVPLEELAKYFNKHVAWFPDGSGVRDSDVDRQALWDRIEASGDDPSWYSYEFVEDTSHLKSKPPCPFGCFANKPFLARAVCFTPIREPPVCPVPSSPCLSSGRGENSSMSDPRSTRPPTVLFLHLGWRS